MAAHKPQENRGGAFADCAGLTEAKFINNTGSGTDEGKNLESIGKDAFKGCTGLTSVTLTGAASLVSIGEGAFEGCVKLDKVELTGANVLATIGDNAFNGIALETVDLSWFPKLTEIGKGAFANSKVEKLWLPESLVTIGDSAFKNCTVLTEALFQKKESSGMVAGDGSKLASIGKDAFKNCEVLKTVQLNATPDGDSQLTELESGVFSGCKALETLTIGLEAVKKIESIGANAFANCAALTTGDLSWFTGLTTIGEGAYAGSSLTELSLPASLTTIEAEAFKGITTLTDVTLPANLKTIGDGAFANCTTLATVTLTSPEPPTLGAGAFDGAGGAERPTFAVAGTEASIGDYLADGDWTAYFFPVEGETETDGFKFIVEGTGTDAKAIITGYKGTTVPEPFTLVIPDKLTVPNEPPTVTATVTAIAAGAFKDVEGLTGVSFPASLTTIGAGAFEGLTGLTSAKLNEKEDGSANATTALKTVGNNAFAGTGLETVVFYNATSLVSIGEGAFKGTRLASVELTGADNLVSIGDSAFKGIGLETVDLSWFTGLKTIGAGAFAESGAKKLWLPESLESIGDSAFAGSKFLEEAKFLKGSGAGAGDGASLTSIGKDAFKGCVALDKVALTGAKSLTEIGEGAFAGAKLTDVALTEAAALKSIGAGAFAGSGLTSLDFDKAGATGLTTIGEEAFKGSTKLTSVQLPASLESIGDEAFAGCTGLTAFHLTSTETTPPPTPTLGDKVFAGVDTKKVTFTAGPTAYVNNDEVRTKYEEDEDWKRYFEPEQESSEPEPEPTPEPSEPSVPGGGSGVNGGFRVAFYNVDGSLLSQTTIAKGDTVPADKVPALEAREGYTLVWYAGRYETNIWDFSSPVTAVLELHALWVEDEDEGEETGVAAVGGGGNGAVALYNLRGQLVRKAIVTRATSLPALREDLGVSSGIYILTTPEGSRKIKL